MGDWFQRCKIGVKGIAIGAESGGGGLGEEKNK